GVAILAQIGCIFCHRVAEKWLPTGVDDDCTRLYDCPARRLRGWRTAVWRCGLGGTRGPDRIVEERQRKTHSREGGTATQRDSRHQRGRERIGSPRKRKRKRKRCRCEWRQPAPLRQ